jgi:hypothetical protein
MDHDWVLAFYVEDADLQQHSVRCWAYEHCQVVVERYSSHRVTHSDEPIGAYTYSKRVLFVAIRIRCQLSAGRIVKEPPASGVTARKCRSSKVTTRFVS